jgi:hypothetical protein
MGLGDVSWLMRWVWVSYFYRKIDEADVYRKDTTVYSSIMDFAKTIPNSGQADM